MVLLCLHTVEQATPLEMCSMRSAERELKRSCGISDDVVVVFVEEEEEYGQAHKLLNSGTARWMKTKMSLPIQPRALGLT